MTQPFRPHAVLIAVAAAESMYGHDPVISVLGGVVVALVLVHLIAALLPVRGTKFLSSRHGRAVKVGISIPPDLANAVDAELARSTGTSKSAFFAEALRLLLSTRDDARLAEQAALLDDGDVEDSAFDALR